MNFPARLSGFLRRTGLLRPADNIRYFMHLVSMGRKNRAFRKENPGIPLPPPYLVYESFRLDYRKYLYDSGETAGWLAGLLLRHGLPEHSVVLDWGCGPGRIVRHLPGITGGRMILHGCDPNKKSVDWCRKNLPGVVFRHSEPVPPLPYPAGTFDAVYGISVLTHLPESLHLAWIRELERVLRPGGLLLLTTQGNAFRCKLSRGELEKFDAGFPVIRGRVKAGHRTFSAFQPPAFMRRLLESFHLLEHSEPGMLNGRPQQDVWVVMTKAGK